MVRFGPFRSGAVWFGSLGMVWSGRVGQPRHGEVRHVEARFGGAVMVR